ncbi:uncharacterized protein LOC113218176 [Frankliniella occidentalis]|uniref:Uncharacterized protein LOC113218176 n=1 Tax=Frankliniella occidentalis TaxID=133901 RepID=A0A6J1TUA9_FRAOC|nr:uncharacterized protein LOC113218176 [Frankliniella occidentalis]XP_026294192.1 uncharacterized protein LOC113218176 [Frankliniella occidentalis]XP_052126500.1 uncharacterized protein LOC113218176 [Frankliniella occidentalis]
MECDICTEHFDGAERLPKSLPCGHTVCLQCLGRLPDRRCPTCRQDFNGPPDGLPTNFMVLRFLKRRRLDSTPRGWCSDCRTAATPRCWEDHDVLAVRSALRRQLQGVLPQAAEQLQGLQDQCRDEQVLPALTLLTCESWGVSLRGGGHELTGTLRNTEEPLTKALCLLLAARAALTEDRAVAGDLAGDPPPAPAAPTTRGQPPAEERLLDVSRVNRSKARLAILRRVILGVTRLHGVHCRPDRDWGLKLLQRVAPSVEELGLCDPSKRHLRALYAMPRLRRLDVWYDDDEDTEKDFSPPVVAFPSGNASLQWLGVCRLHGHTLLSLLQAHSRTLEVLQVTLGTGVQTGWPWHSCDDLYRLLQQCDLPALQLLVLDRDCYGEYHEPGQCNEQLAQVRRVLPRADVQCTYCDPVSAEHF